MNEGQKEMTAQIAERLLYEGSEHAMCTNPLDDYFAMAGARPLFAVSYTHLTLPTTPYV